MADITQIIRFDDLASKDSPIHNLEGRIKLISTIFHHYRLCRVQRAFHTDNTGNIFIDCAQNSRFVIY